jgi:hypothetical protein
MDLEDLLGAINRRKSIARAGKVKVARKLIKTRAASFAELLSAHDGKSPYEIQQFEVKGMMAAEREQTSQKDTFWGFDREAMNCGRDRKEMIAEDRRSKKHELYMKHIQKLADWRREEVEDQVTRAKRAQKENEEKQARYMQLFMSAESTTSIKNYSWRNEELPEESQSSNQEFLEAFYGPSEDFGEEEEVDLFHLDDQGGIQSPGKHSTIHLNGKLQTRIVAPKIKEPTISPKKSSAGSIADSVYLQPGTWLKRDHRTAATRQEGGNGKELLLARTQKIRNLPHLLSEPKYTNDFEGHPVYKWDQYRALRAAFTVLDRHGDGSISRAALTAIEMDYRIHAILRYTVFGAWIKKKQWTEFYKAFDKLCGGNNSKKLASSGDSSEQSSAPNGGSKGRMTVNQWVTAAQDFASFEEKVSVTNIRTDEEHRELTVLRNSEDWSMLLDSEHNNSRSWYAENMRNSHFQMLRNCRLRRCLSRGDSVWGRHCGGTQWLPAVVEAAAPGGLSYSLRYPLTVQELQHARSEASSRQFLGELSKESGKGNQFEMVPVKPAKTEIEVCGYAFDKVDKFGSGSVDARVLLNTISTPRFELVVSTSYCLSHLMQPNISQELLGVVEDKARAEKRLPSMVISKADFLVFCSAIEQLAMLHNDLYR